MLRVRGIYDGERIRLLEPVTIPPDTEVEVLVPDQQPASTTDMLGIESEEQREEKLLQELAAAGIITRARRPKEWDDSFAPIPITGEPLSETIIRERR